MIMSECIYRVLYAFVGLLTNFSLFIKHYMIAHECPPEEQVRILRIIEQLLTIWHDLGYSVHD